MKPRINPFKWKTLTSGRLIKVRTHSNNPRPNADAGPAQMLVGGSRSLPGQELETAVGRGGDEAEEVGSL